MNTIEMINELFENGGSFTFSDDDNCFVGLSRSGILTWFSKETGLAGQFVVISTSFMGFNWKPYIKPVDWSKVPIDTKVICTSNGRPYRRHFAGVRNGKPTVWDSGNTSWSTFDSVIAYEWDEVKLVEE